jgi:proteasome lid subunit RPN8/RPN11
MSDVQDPQEIEPVRQEPAQPAADKKIVFGVRKPTEETSAITGLPLIIEAPFPTERTLQWMPEIWSPAVSNSTDGVEEPANEPEPGEAQDTSINTSEFAPPLDPNGNSLVIVSQEVLLKVNEHVSQSLERELGGFLLGNRYRCPNTQCDYVIIDQCSPAKFTESTSVRLAFTHEAWAQLSDELSGKFFGKLLIGWYHSHPRLDVFLSSHDQEIQRERFSEPWMVALVLEPEKHRGGFFCERNGRVSPNSPVDFFELLERNSRDSVLAWENYNAVDPSTSSAPALSETNTATLRANSSAEIQAARNAKSKKVLPKRGNRRRLLFALALVTALLGGVAVVIVNRHRLRTWIRDNNIWQKAPSPVPTPSVEAGPTLQVAPSSSPDQFASPTPTQSSGSQPESAPKQEASPTPLPASSPAGVGANPDSLK